MDTGSELALHGLKSRQYRSPGDFETMKAILEEGRTMQTGCYYVHVGDLSWWLYYVDSDDDVWRHVFLWEDTRGEIAGWTLFSPHFRTFDVFLKPGVYASETAARIFEWSTNRCEEIVRKAGGKAIRTMWISEADAVTRRILFKLGFEQTANCYLVMERSIEVLEPDPEPVPGIRLRHVAGEADLLPRAAVSYATFESQLPFDGYCQRYLNFMSSPVYKASLDVVAEDANGSFVAFCICWLDAVNRLGHFEPVGVHPDHRRRGLGKAILREGMQRMRSDGMLTAMVCADSENLAALRLYESVGFECVDRLFTFERGS